MIADMENSTALTLDIPAVLDAPFAADAIQRRIDAAQDRYAAALRAAEVRRMQVWLARELLADEATREAALAGLRLGSVVTTLSEVDCPGRVDGIHSGRGVADQVTVTWNSGGQSTLPATALRVVRL